MMHFANRWLARQIVHVKGDTMGRDFWLFVGGVAAGLVGAALLAKSRDKVKPMAAGMVAKGIRLKEKALDMAAKTKEQADEIVAEAKQINEASGTGE